MQATRVRPLHTYDNQQPFETRGGKTRGLMDETDWLWCSYQTFLQFMARWYSPAGVPTLENFDPTKLQDKHEHGRQDTNTNH